MLNFLKKNLYISKSKVNKQAREATAEKGEDKSFTIIYWLKER